MDYKFLLYDLKRLNKSFKNISRITTLHTLRNFFANFAVKIKK